VTNHLGAMTATTTALLLILVLALGALCGWLGARAPDLHKGPRLIPYRFLMMGCAAIALVLVVHLVNLAGFETGSRNLY
jgi:hypothetical protein